MPLDTRVAALGSRNPAKVAAVRQALAAVAPGCALVLCDVDSGAGEQPLGDVATRDGARRRAAGARDEADADLGFGLEGGVLIEQGRPWLVSWAVAVGRDGTTGEASARMPLPPRVGPRLLAGDELGVIVDDLFRVQGSKTQGGAVGLLTDGALTRTDAFAQLVLMSLAPLIRRDVYEEKDR